MKIVIRLLLMLSVGAGSYLMASDGSEWAAARLFDATLEWPTDAESLRCMSVYEYGYAEYWSQPVYDQVKGKSVRERSAFGPLSCKEVPWRLLSLWQHALSSKARELMNTYADCYLQQVRFHAPELDTASLRRIKRWILSLAILYFCVENCDNPHMQLLLWVVPATIRGEWNRQDLPRSTMSILCALNDIGSYGFLVWMEASGCPAIRLNAAAEKEKDAVSEAEQFVARYWDHVLLGAPEDAGLIEFLSDSRSSSYIRGLPADIKSLYYSLSRYLTQVWIYMSPAERSILGQRINTALSGLKNLRDERVRKFFSCPLVMHHIRRWLIGIYLGVAHQNQPFQFKSVDLLSKYLSLVSREYLWLVKLGDMNEECFKPIQKAMDDLEEMLSSESLVSDTSTTYEAGSEGEQSGSSDEEAAADRKKLVDGGLVEGDQEVACV